MITSLLEALADFFYDPVHFWISPLILVTLGLLGQKVRIWIRGRSQANSSDRSGKQKS